MVITTAMVEGVEEGVVSVSRPALTVNSRHARYRYTTPEEKGIRERISARARAWVQCSGGRVWAWVRARVPVVAWLPQYAPKKAFMGDAISGITVAIMQIAQGMAYAVLAGLPPVVGLYMAFFPVLFYVPLGTSPHVSMGSYAVGCLMMAKSVGELATPQTSNVTAINGTLAEVPGDGDGVQYTPVQVAMALALAVGVWEVVLGLLQLGEVFGRFLCDMLISGFTTAVGTQLFVSQLKYLFGVPVPRYTGPFKIVYMFVDVVRQLPSTNLVVLGMSVVIIAVLVLNNELLKPRVKKVTNLPIPIELMAVVVGTLVSFLLDLETNHDVLVVGPIPTGLPAPSVPPLALMPRVMLDGFIIGVIGFTSTFSLSKIFAKKHGYEVDATQELYAHGVSNIAGSFFSCGPIAAALSRSLIQETLGASSLLTALISCVCLLFILLFIGPLFQTLPNCVLAAIIVVALKGLFMQFRDVAKAWRVSRPDALIWLATFTASVVIDIDYGLLVGVGVSVLVLLTKTQQLPLARLGKVKGTDLYLDVEKYEAAVEVDGVRVVRVGGPIHFGNVAQLRKHLLATAGVNTHTTDAKLVKDKNRKEGPAFAISHSNSPSKAPMVTDPDPSKTYPSPAHYVYMQVEVVEALVVELSAVSFVDASGAAYLKELHKDLQQAGIALHLAAPTEGVLAQLERSGVVDAVGTEHIYHSTHDAMVMMDRCSAEATVTS